MVYDKNRNDADDPVLHDSLRRPGDGAPGQGGSQLGSTGNAPIQVTTRDPGNYPVGGQVVTVNAVVTDTAHFATSSDQMVTVLQWSSKDGNARRGFVTLVPNNQKRQTADRNQYAVWCRITMGSARGAVTFWQMAPAIVPVQCTYLRIDALIALAGNKLAFGGTLPNAPTIPVIPTIPLSWDLNANWFDEDADRYPDPTILGPSLVPCSQVSTPQWIGPAIIDSIELTNTNATAAVFIVIGDTTASGPPNFVPGVDVGMVCVPAQSTVSVGRSLLGAFSNGVSLFGTTTFTGSFTDDPNGANVYATIRGTYLQPGS